MNCANHNDIAAVAFCRTCGKPLCNTCTRDVRGVIYCESCLAARLDGTAPAAGFVPPQTPYQPIAGLGAKPSLGNSGPNPTVAGILGAIPFGIGAVYNSQYTKGLAHLAIFVFLIIAVGSDLPWYMITLISISMGFFWFYQIFDAIRTAKAIQAGEPVPDPFGLGQTFGAGEKVDATKVPTGSVILIGLGVLFLLHTVGIFDFSLHRYWPLILIFLGVWLFAKQWGLIGGSYAACPCERCRTRKLMGPAILVTVGVLFLLHTVGPVSIWRTWPAILLVIGVVKLLQSNSSAEGHLDRLPFGTPLNVAPPSPPPPPVPPVPPSAEQPPSSGEVNHV